MIVKTKYSAGGLISRIAVGAPRLAAPANFVAPVYLDSRPYCLPTDDQGQSSMCAGFATAGWLEVCQWKLTHVPKQVDAVAIYHKAKEFDQMSGPGTTLEAAAEAATQLKLVPDGLEPMFFMAPDLVKYALHRHSVAVVGLTIDENWNRCDGDSGWIGGEKDVSGLGGHAVLACWYSDKGVGVQNSWGQWGCRGFGRMTWEQFNRQFMGGYVFQ